MTGSKNDKLQRSGGGSFTTAESPVSFALTLISAGSRLVDRSLLRVSARQWTKRDVALRLAGLTAAGQGREVVKWIFSNRTGPDKLIGKGRV